MKAPYSTKSPAVPLPTSSDYIAEIRAILDHLDTAAIDRISAAVWEGYQAGRTLFIFGNGGSAALASHLACDIGKGTMAREKPPLKVVSLTDNVPLMTAWANDHSYDEIFAQQLRGLAHPGDLALAISGSGNSKNVVRGLETAREMGLQPLALTGFGGGKVKNLCELCLIVPSDCMQHVEDAHLCAAHAIFTAVYRRMHHGN
jgi:D-sedoheptulose 7-phosphate isomerase